MCQACDKHVPSRAQNASRLLLMEASGAVADWYVGWLAGCGAGACPARAPRRSRVSQTMAPGGGEVGELAAAQQAARPAVAAQLSRWQGRVRGVLMPVEAPPLPRGCDFAARWRNAAGARTAELAGVRWLAG